MNKFFLFFVLLLSSFTGLHANSVFQNHKPRIEKKVLSNGLTILVVSRNTCAPVCVYLLYDVGSKHEKDGEKGIAHLIEHMIFKGTQKLSETDIKLIVNKLSGNCNAQTSMDYTGYYFNVPAAHWQQIIPIMADCMQHAAFKEEHLTSEMKVVIQELKRNRDNYQREVWHELCKLIYSDHPYHYPIIGYKHDLWNLHADDLHSFYKKYYHPNNAALVVVGDVDSHAVFMEAETHFGQIPAGKLPKSEFYLTPDISAKTVTLYRNVVQPKVMLCYAIPENNKTNEYTQAMIAQLLTSGKNGLLTKKLVEEMQLVNYCWAAPLTQFEHTLFLVGYEPKSLDDIQTINQLIQKEIDALKEKIDDAHLKAVCNQVRVGHLDLLQDNNALALTVGNCFWAVNDPEYAFHVFDEVPLDETKQAITAMIKQYFRTTVRHQALVLPLPEEEKEQWLALQEQSDNDDERILSGRIRTDSVEGANYANTLPEPEAPHFSFAKPEVSKLENGITVFSYHTTDIPKIELVLELKVDHYYDPDDKEGLCNFVGCLLREGTKNYTAEQLAQEFQSRAISFNVADGFITMSFLSSELSFALRILHEILTNATFDEKVIEKIRAQLFAHIDNYWDQAGNIAHTLTKEHLFGDQFLSKNGLGSHESITSITRDELVNFYKMYFSPHHAKLSVVGDLSVCDLTEILEKELGTWRGSEIKDLPDVKEQPVVAKEITHHLNRDQMLLSFVGPSVKRADADYDALLVFDHIMCSGMASKLFQLRERSGAFYAIGGSVISHCTGYATAPRAVDISCNVSLDRLQQAEEMIRDLMKTAPDLLTEQEINQAKRSIVHAAAHAYATNSAIAHTFLYLDRYNLPFDYFDNRIDALQSITLDEVKKAAKKVLNLDSLSTIKVGRV